jgi:hypothetical protein
VQVRNYFLSPAMPMRVVSGKFRLSRVGLRIGILMLIMLMDAKKNVLNVERNHFRKL